MAIKNCYYYKLSKISLSATSAINSLFVGRSLPIYTLAPNIELIASVLPRFHATSIAWRIALSTLLAVVTNFLAILG